MSECNLSYIALLVELVEMSSSSTTQLRSDFERSFDTLAEMLADRGVDAPEIRSHLGNAGALFDASKPTLVVASPTAKVLVVYDFSARFKVSNVKVYLDQEYMDQEYATTILVIREKPTAAVIKSLREYQKTDVQLFLMKNLVFNVTKHELVPRHEVIRDEAAMQAILDAYQLKHKHHLPLIYDDDPVAKYYGLKPGQLVRVTRITPSTGEAVAYRCCVKNS